MKNTKLSAMAITSCTQIAFLVAFASAAIMGFLVQAETCNETLGTCQGIDCNQICINKHPGGSGTCDQTNNCRCFYECPPAKKCNAGLGRCSWHCNEKCCEEKCATQYKDGVGFCDTLGYQSMCQCKYTCY